MNEIDRNTFPDDVWQGTESHPQCCFFELFPSSQDPYETFYGELFCHMDNTGESAKICKGDYCKCPLCNGDIRSKLENLLGELESREEQFEKVFYGTIDSPNKSMPREYWEGLVSGYKSSIIYLWKYFPELKERKE